jgi:hypothetical protein
MSRSDSSQPTSQVRIRAKITTPEFSTDALTHDINREGATFYSHREVAPGTLVSLTLSLLLGQNSASEPLQLTGKVLWCTEVKDSLFQLGATFTGMDGQRMGYLDIFLRLLQQELVLDLDADEE